MANKGQNRNFIQATADWITWPRFIFAVLLLFFLTGILFPFYWMVSSSFKTYAEIGSREPVYIPSALRFDAYRELFDPNDPGFWDFGTNIVNTIILSIPTALIAVILSTLGAYAIARLAYNEASPESRSIASL